MRRKFSVVPVGNCRRGPRRSARRLGGCAVLAGALLASYPAIGQAANFCVHQPGTWCAGVAVNGTIDEGTDLQHALNDAATAPQYAGLDNVVIGPGTFAAASGFSYVSSDPVDIIGTGVGQTVLTSGGGTNTVLTLSGGAHGLTQVTLSILAHGYGLALTGGTAQNIAVTAAPASTPQHGVTLGAGAVLKQSMVDLTAASGDTDGPVSVDPGGGKTATLTDDSVAGAYGVQVFTGSATMSRLRLDNTQLDVAVTSGASGTIDASLLLAHGTNQPALVAGGTLAATSVTVVGDGAGTGASSYAPQNGQHAVLTLSDSTVTGFASDLAQYAGAGATADLTASYSNFAPPVSGTGTGTVTTSDHNVNVNPGFVSGTDRHLRFDSPLIDAGASCSGLSCFVFEDFGQNPRFVDGNGDGSALEDIGAYEYQRRAPVATVSAPATSAAGTPVTFDASGSHDPDPGDTLTYAWSFDDGGSATGATVVHAFATGATHTGTVTVTDPTGRTATAAASVVVSPPAAAPTIAINAPGNGATYQQDQVVLASYSCSAPAGAMITACSGPVASGAPIDTTTLGMHSFTVTASASDSLSAARTASYSITPIPPSITALTQSATTWRAGSSVAHMSRKLGVGTVFSFHLNEQASVALSFMQAATGRKLRGKCVPKATKNKHRPRCTRTIAAGTLKLTAHQGTNKVHFAGRLSRSKLKPGHYTLTIIATNASGQHVSSRSLSFTTVK